MNFDICEVRALEQISEAMSTFGTIRKFWAYKSYLYKLAKTQDETFIWVKTSSIGATLNNTCRIYERECREVCIDNF